MVITTVGTEEEANKLAEELVVRRHAACVNVLPIRKSVYRWQEKLCQESEFLLLIKSVADEYPAIEAAIRELHSYDLAEILCFNVSRGEERYLAWLAESVQKTPPQATDSDG